MLKKSPLSNRSLKKYIDKMCLVPSNSINLDPLILAGGHYFYDDFQGFLPESKFLVADVGHQAYQRKTNSRNPMCGNL